MKLADAHLHLFRHGYFDRYPKGWAMRDELAAYEALRSVHGIERGLVVGYEGQPRFRGNNRQLAAWARRRSWMTPLAFVPAATAPSPTTLGRLAAAGFAGISLYCPSPKEAERIREWPAAVSGWLGARRWIVSVNAGPESLAAMAPFLRRIEGGFVLVSHLGLPGRHAAAPSRARALAILRPLCSLAACPHVGVKISGLYAVSEPSHAYPHASARPFVARILDAFGAGRLFWGSDFSPALEHVSFVQTIQAIQELGWSDELLEGVLHRNLVRLLDSR